MKLENFKNISLDELNILCSKTLVNVISRDLLILDDKIGLLRKLNKTVIYNDDMRINQINDYFFVHVLNDLDRIHKIEEIFDVGDKMKNSLLYIRLFLMYLYNISNSDSNYKEILFQKIFNDEKNLKIFNSIILITLKDIKVQKFLLGIFYNLIFNQYKNLNKIKNLDIFVGFFCILVNKILESYHFEENMKKFDEISQEEKDLNEINDWMHIVFNSLLKNDNFISIEYEAFTNKNFLFILKESHMENIDKISLFSILSKKEIVGEFYYIFLEIFRDCVEYSKSVNSEKFFIVTKYNFGILFTLLKLNIINLIEINTELILSKNFEEFEKYSFGKLKFMNANNKIDEIKIDYKTLKSIDFYFESSKYNYCNESDLKKIIIFKEFICLVDIFSIFLVTEEYRIYFHELNYNFDFIDKLSSLMKLTDFIYDDYFFRFKSLKNNEKDQLSYKKLNENNIYFSLQSNIMKFLSNFCYKNENSKKKLIDNPDLLLYFLNHMKIDSCNPFKKEWTVLLIKSLCENNSKIQKLIEGLRPQQIDPLLKDYVISDKNNYKFPDEVQEDLLKNINK